MPSDPPESAEGEIECTAFDQSATNDRNALFTPPCACPRCAPTEADRHTHDDAGHTLWLDVGGRRVRHDVQALDLGEAGRHMLG